MTILHQISQSGSKALQELLGEDEATDARRATAESSPYQPDPVPDNWDNWGDFANGPEHDNWHDWSNK